MRRFGAAMVLSGLVASGMIVGGTRVEAKGKGGGGEGTVCSALLAVITYKYTSPTIRDYATGLYLSYGCDPSFLPK
ncbi:MAG TPA: hypothetical protein VKE96_29485 [Vicinamibacterales bacterium]|nr:hypothetical protein [Vicinamibacterales bacterium]